MKILIVEDEPTVSGPLRDYLKKEGFEITLANTLKAGNSEALRAEPDLVLLDWMLPDGQGIELLRQWRTQGRLFPVILLTARTDLVDKVVGLELGANDYITKPFEPRELIARIRVQLRTKPPVTQPAGTSGIEIDLQGREARYQGRTVELTKTEFELLKLLVQNPNQVFSREELLKKVWGYDNYPSTRTVDTHILQLRTKFSSEIFETVHGVGYRLKILTNLLQRPDNKE